MIALFGASSIEAISIPIEKQSETYEILQTAPLSTTNILFGKSLAGSAFGMMLSFATTLGAVFITRDSIANPLLFLVAMIVGTFAFSSFGMLIAAGVKDMPTANMSLTALRLPMMFISGVFIPVQSLPVWLQVVSYLTPLNYMVDALREAMTGPSIMFAVDLLVLLFWFIVLQSFAVMVLNRKTST